MGFSRMDQSTILFVKQDTQKEGQDGILLPFFVQLVHLKDVYKRTTLVFYLRNILLVFRALRYNGEDLFRL